MNVKLIIKNIKIMATVSIGDATNGKRKADDAGDPGNFRHTKAFGKYYVGKIAAGLLGIVVFLQLINNVLDFWFPNNNNRKTERHDGGRRNGNNRR
jgi:hypothetical protein